MPSRLNKLMLQEMKEQFKGVEACFFIDFSRLNGRKAADLRDQLRSECGDGAAFSIVKNSLARRALAGLADGALDDYLDGPTAVAYGADDPVLLARTLADWGKKEHLLRFKGGVLDGALLAPADVAALALIPPKPVLMGQVVGTIAAPLTSLLNVGTGLIRKIFALADALGGKKSESSAGSADNASD